MKKILIIVLPVIAAVAISLTVLPNMVMKNQKHDIAMNLLETGAYEAAYALLEETGDLETITSSKGERAMKYLESEDYQEAYVLLEEIGDYETIAVSKNEREMARKKADHYADKEKYDNAVTLMNAGRYDAAISRLWNLDYLDSEELIDECYRNIYDEETYESFSNIEIGDIYVIGEYEQNNNQLDDDEPLEWIVLDKKGIALLLISRYSLDVREYNDDDVDVTWETCSLRTWLNGKFYLTTFNEEEIKQIREVAVPAHPNPVYGTPVGNETTDHVFLLSVQEADKYFPTEEDKKVRPTPYALSRGAYTSSGLQKDQGLPTFWWLRTPGQDSRYTAFISTLGVLRTEGLGEMGWDGGIRPAMWIEPAR